MSATRKPRDVEHHLKSLFNNKASVPPSDAPAQTQPKRKQWRLKYVEVGKVPFRVSIATPVLMPI